MQDGLFFWKRLARPHLKWPIIQNEMSNSEDSADWCNKGMSSNKYSSDTNGLEIDPNKTAVLSV